MYCSIDIRYRTISTITPWLGNIIDYDYDNYWADSKTDYVQVATYLQIV